MTNSSQRAFIVRRNDRLAVVTMNLHNGRNSLSSFPVINACWQLYYVLYVMLRSHGLTLATPDSVRFFLIDAAVTRSNPTDRTAYQRRSISPLLGPKQEALFTVRSRRGATVRIRQERPVAVPAIRRPNRKQTWPPNGDHRGPCHQAAAGQLALPPSSYAWHPITRWISHAWANSGSNSSTTTAAAAAAVTVAAASKR